MFESYSDEPGYHSSLDKLQQPQLISPVSGGSIQAWRGGRWCFPRVSGTQWWKPLCRQTTPVLGTYHPFSICHESWHFSSSGGTSLSVKLLPLISNVTSYIFLPIKVTCQDPNKSGKTAVNSGRSHKYTLLCIARNKSLAADALAEANSTLKINYTEAWISGYSAVWTNTEEEECFFGLTCQLLWCVLWCLYTKEEDFWWYKAVYVLIKCLNPTSIRAEYPVFSSSPRFQFLQRENIKPQSVPKV